MRGALGLGLGLALALGACRTPVPLKKAGPAPGDPIIYEDKACNVHDYPAASDLPEGAKNLGLVRVARQGSDEETYLALREAICAKGGDALSQLHWVLQVGKFTGAPTDLEANAWQLP